MYQTDPPSPTLSKVVFPSFAASAHRELSTDDEIAGNLMTDTEGEGEGLGLNRRRSRSSLSNTPKSWRHSAPGSEGPASVTYTRTTRTSTTTRVRYGSATSSPVPSAPTSRNSSPTRNRRPMRHSNQSATSLHSLDARLHVPSSPPTPIHRTKSNPNTPSRTRPRTTSGHDDGYAFLTTDAGFEQSPARESRRSSTFSSRPPSPTPSLGSRVGLSSKRVQDLVRLGSTIDSLARYAILFSFGIMTLAALCSMLLASYGLSAFDDVRRARKARRNSGNANSDEDGRSSPPPSGKPQRPPIAVLIPSLLLSLTVLAVRSVHLLIKTSTEPKSSRPSSPMRG